MSPTRPNYHKVLNQAVIVYLATELMESGLGGSDIFKLSTFVKNVQADTELGPVLNAFFDPKKCCCEILDKKITIPSLVQIYKDSNDEEIYIDEDVESYFHSVLCCIVLQIDGLHKQGHKLFDVMLIVFPGVIGKNSVKEMQKFIGKSLSLPKKEYFELLDNFPSKLII